MVKRKQKRFQEIQKEKEIVNLTENAYFDVKLNVGVKTDASQIVKALRPINSVGGLEIRFTANSLLNYHEARYSTKNLKKLGVFLAVEHYENHLYGAVFVIITDHRALFSALSCKKKIKLFGAV